MSAKRAMTENRLFDIASAMSRPDFYPHPAPGLQRRETHISLVFLAGAAVYKIKKPVAFDFLDFSTLEKRRRFCEEEVRLNRRLTEGVYLSVVSITDEGGRLALDGPGKVVEYAVKMKRLEQDHTMGVMLDEGALQTGDLHRLAGKLAEFFRAASVSRQVGGWTTVVENCRENFKEMKPFVGSLISPPRYELVRAATDGFLSRRRALFEERLETGCVRDCHGDLRTEHIYFTPTGIQVIDCVEFNERMRINDPASDIAFLAMDLDYRGAFGAASEILEAFVPRLGDLRILALLDFYLCYRACVRLKVTCFRLQQGGLEEDLRRQLLERTRTFAALACRYAKRFPAPTVYVVMGMIAAGKSTVAGALSGAIDARLLSSDKIRKEMFRSKDGAGARFGAGIYRPEARRRVYARMLLRAEEQLRSRRSVVLDATFGRQRERTEAMRLAADTGARVVFIECRCPEKIIRRRLKSRETAPTISDARLPLLHEFQKQYVPPSEIPSFLRVTVDTTSPVESVVSRIYVSSRQAAGFAAEKDALLRRLTDFD